MEFRAFPKLARLSREIVVTEKIDGTNAQIYIDDVTIADGAIAEVDGWGLWAGSRTRWITPDNDNFGFAQWVVDHADELVKLGHGQHFGEWWGKGIQRGYGLEEKRFSLFNTSRWDQSNIPACCSVVPELYRGTMNEEAIEICLFGLNKHGSVAAPGFMKPEGVVVFHTAANMAFKKTIEKDESPKGNPPVTK